MLKIYLLTILILSVALISCDPGFSIIISNKSKVDRNIRVIYPGSFKLPINTKDSTNDSLQTYDHTLTDNTISTRDYYRHPVKTPVLSLDTANRTYSFNLKARHEVIIEEHWPGSSPTFGQIFIIDNTDTIKLKKHGRDFKKSPKLLLGGGWYYTITDNKK